MAMLFIENILIGAYLNQKAIFALTANDYVSSLYQSVKLHVLWSPANIYTKKNITYHIPY